MTLDCLTIRICLQIMRRMLWWTLTLSALKVIKILAEEEGVHSVSEASVASGHSRSKANQFFHCSIIIFIITFF